MSTSRTGRRALLGGALAAVCLGLGATAAFGDTIIDTGHQVGNTQLTVGTFYDQAEVSDAVQGDYPCFDGVIGTITGTDTLFGHYINSPDIFHFEGTDTFDYRVDFNDGRYAIGAFSGRTAFNANPSQGHTTEIETDTGQEQATVYAPDGTIGTVTVRNVFHTTWIDLNGDRQIQPSELRSTVDNFRVSCP